VASLHEDLERTDVVKGGSDRAFGLTVGGILLLIAAWRAWSGGIGAIEVGMVVIGLILVILGAIAPATLAPLNRLWIKLGILLSKIVSPIALAVVYGVAIVPIGLIRRALGHDPLRLKRDPAAESYWIRRDPPGPAPDGMPQQF
jgi:hypothetical protein